MLGLRYAPSQPTTTIYIEPKICTLSLHASVTIRSSSNPTALLRLLAFFGFSSGGSYATSENAYDRRQSSSSYDSL